MAKSDGSVIIDTRMNTSGFQTGVANMKKGFNGLSSSLGKIAKVMAGVFAVKQLVQFGKEAIELGSDLSEVQNVVDVTFGNLNEEINEFAKNAIEQFGLSETAAKQYTSTMGAMLKSMGFTTREAADMSKTMTGLAADMASFYNLDAEDAFYKIRAGISGETEPLKQLGINLNVANLEQYALTQGITKSYNAMTQQEQALLRYNYLLKVTADAQGDFARTSDSWANQTRILTERFKALKATIGQGLINLFTPVIRVINTLLAKLATVANAFKAFTELITGKKSSGSTSASAAGFGGSTTTDMADGYNQAADGAENLAGATEDAADATKKANKANKTYLSGLDEVHRYTEDIAEAIQSQDGNASSIDELAGSGVGNSVDYGTLAEGETVIDKVNDKIIRLQQILSGFFQPFKDAWEIEGKKTTESVQYAFSSIIELAKNVGKSIYDVWTNGTGTTMLSTVLNITQNILNTVGNLATRFSEAWNTAGVGTSIVQNIANIFQSVLNYVNNIANATRNWASNLNFYPLLNAIKNSTSALASYFPVIQSFLINIYQNIILPLFTFLIERGLPTLINGFAGFYNFLSEHQWIVDLLASAILGMFAAEKIAPKIAAFVGFIKTAIDVLSGAGGLKGAIDIIITALGGPLTLAIFAVIAAGILLISNWDAVKEAAKKLLENYLSPLAEFIKGIFLSAWTDVLKPALEYFSDTVLPTLSSTFENLWNNVLIPLGDFLSEVFKPIFEALIKVLKELWKYIIVPLAKLLGTTFKGAFETVSTFVNGVVIPVIGTLIDVLGKLWKNFLVPIGNFLKNTFGPIFEEVFGTIGDIIAGFDEILGGAIDFIKEGVNGVIGFVNGLIEKINAFTGKVNQALTFDIGFTNPFTGNYIGFSHTMNIPMINTIPYLAKGAVIPPNAPFTAVLGDQKHGTNIEAPLSTIEQAVTNALKKNNSGGQNVTIRIPVILEGRQIFEAIIDEAKMKQMISGRNPFEMA